MDVTSVKRIHQSDWTDSGIRFLRARDIVAESKNEEVTEPLFISEEKYEEYSALSGKVKPGDLLVTGVGTIGVPMLIKSDEPVYFKDGNIIWFKNENTIDGKFFYHSFNGEGVQKFIKESAGIGTVGTYTIDSGKKTPINLPPSKEEQIKIGEYFDDLDNLITLHQRKGDETNILKIYILTKMFPKNGELYSQKRFNGFYDAWEQRKLSDLTDYSNGTGHEESVVAQGKYELITLKSINSEGELVSSEKYVDEEFETLKQGTLIMMLSEQAKGMLGMTTVIPCNDRYVLNQRVAALNLHDKINASFLTKAINNKQAYFEQMGAGTKVQNISKGHVENCLIDIPCYEEQQRIGGYFNKLDKLITLHQHKCIRCDY